MSRELEWATPNEVLWACPKCDYKVRSPKEGAAPQCPRHPYDDMSAK